MASVRPLLFINFIFIPEKAPFNRSTSFNRFMLSSAMVIIGLCSVTQAISSIMATGIGCSTRITIFSFIQNIISSTICLSCHPWLTSTYNGLSEYFLIIFINALSSFVPALIFKIEKSVASLIFCSIFCSSSIPIVKEVGKALLFPKPITS